MIGKSCISDANYDFLRREMIGRKRFLEIGTYDGVTVSKLAQEFPDKQFVVIDNFFEGNEDHFIHNNFENKNVQVIKDSSQMALLYISMEEWKFDLIFIDGEHTYHTVKGDFMMSYPLLTENGMIVFHDSTHKEVRKAIDEVCKKIGLTLCLFDNFLSWVERK